jgi:hypothetical protein
MRASRVFGGEAFWLDLSMDFRRYYSLFILPGTAIFALLWAIARACVQSITIDEADTYLVWVARHDPSHWQGASNNHILNSLLMRLFTSVFGVSHFRSALRPCWARLCTSARRICFAGS